MKKVVLICLVATFSIILNSGCNTAAEVADKTVLNSDKIIYSYEQFYAKHEQYLQYQKQLADADKKMQQLKKEGIKSGQEYDNLSMEISGIRNMKNRIASDYNTMSKVYWNKIWKDKGLPESLE